ncbi:MAG: peptidyl-prolyl cis-trans isomerase [Zoogloeaceae bacterium]|nr:peptidyl-prolyl cis-trans isomerase [Zoogloeaceae bacterium]
MRMKKMLAVFLTGLVVSASAWAADVFVTVNGSAVPQYRADVLFNEQKASGVEINDRTRDAVREALVRSELIAVEARRSGMDKEAEVRGLMENASTSVLVRAYLDKYLRENPVSDAEVTEAYDALKQQVGSTEYHVRHILLDTEAAAKAVIAKLGKGGKFAALAKESKDEGSKNQGGDLGWSSPAAFVPPFAEALQKMSKGQYSKEPVQTDFGYHVLLVEDVRPAKLPALDQLRGQIEQRLNMRKVDSLIEELRGKAEIK